MISTRLSNWSLTALQKVPNFHFQILNISCRYVIKATTYEVSFLVDVPNDDKTLENVTQVTRDQVDISFYGAESNDSFVNLGDVPLPIQSKVPGQIGISTVHIGSVQNVADILEKLPFSASIVNITESGTSFVKINRENVTEAEQEIQLSDDADLSKLPILNNVLLPDSFETNRIEH